MLKRIRQIVFINVFFRVIFKASSNAFNDFFDFIIARWPTAGVTAFNYNGHDFKMYNQCDDGHINVFYYGKRYNEDTDLKLFIQLAKHSKTIVDIGANTGMFSVMSGVINKQAKIFAFEPYYPNFKRLSINIEVV